VEKLKKENYLIISIEQDNSSIDYKKISEKINSEEFKNKKIAVIMGSETLGVNKEVLKISDFIAELPMYGFKNSLNVSVTTGIILYSFFDKNFIT
jgi:tRNA G18 (ribose-2'-O)-methylase SpoU